MKKCIVLCADDYGQAQPISEAIIDLLQQGRLTAVSCMANSSEWPEHARWLHPFKSKADIGLHFNLTEGSPLSTKYRDYYGNSFYALPTLIGRAVFHRLNHQALIAELAAQVDAFVVEMGVLPAFIDGHQHVHQFPMIRQAVLAIYAERFKFGAHYIRLVNPILRAKDIFKDPKKTVVRLLGARALQQSLIAENIQHNTSFSGMYHFAKSADYAQLFPSFLQECSNGGLVMCHPGFVGSKITDAIAQARWHEYQYLKSEQFLTDSQNVQYLPLIAGS